MTERILSAFEWEILRSKVDSSENERARILHLSRRLTDEKAQSFANALSQIVGVEAIQPSSPYAISIFIGRCFNVDVVVADIEDKTKLFLSDLVLPNKTLSIVKQ